MIAQVHDGETETGDGTGRRRVERERGDVLSEGQLAVGQLQHDHQPSR